MYVKVAKGEDDDLKISQPKDSQRRSLVLSTSDTYLSNILIEPRTIVGRVPIEEREMGKNYSFVTTWTGILRFHENEMETEAFFRPCLTFIELPHILTDEESLNSLLSLEKRIFDQIIWYIDWKTWLPESEESHRLKHLYQILSTVMKEEFVKATKILVIRPVDSDKDHDYIKDTVKRAFDDFNDFNDTFPEIYVLDQGGPFKRQLWKKKAKIFFNGPFMDCRDGFCTKEHEQDLPFGQSFVWPGYPNEFINKINQTVNVSCYATFDDTRGEVS